MRIAVAILSAYVLLFQAMVGSAAWPSESALSFASSVLPCHALDADTSETSGSKPALPAGSHDCCDLCALLAPAILPAQPVLSRRVAIAHRAAVTVERAVRPRGARAWTPRQSQGPPIA